MLSQSLYEVRDPRFKDLLILNATLETLHHDCLWAEGPVWCSDWEILVFSDIPNSRMLRWTAGGGISVFRAQSNFANGNTRDRQGRLITCEHGTRRVIRTEPDGAITVLAERYKGGRLNSPNDVVVHQDGSIWFTDPTYGILSDYEGFIAEPEQTSQRVYRIDPESGDVAAVVEDFVQPNGLAFSPDFSKLYIADSGASHDETAPHHIRAFDVVGNGLSGGDIFADIDAGVPDGMRVDTQGRVWTSAKDGIHCLDTDGNLMGKIFIPETVANLTFGGERRNRLFITATSGLYALYVNASGCAFP